MKKLSCLIVLTLVFYTVFAQFDSKAKEVLDKVGVNIKSYTTIKAEFSSTIDNTRDDINETFKGTIFIKNNKYKLLYMGTEIFCDGKTIWTFLSEVQEVNIAKPDSEDKNAFNPTKMFSSYVSDYKKDFKYKLNGEEILNGKTVYEIDLFPIDIKNKYSRIKLKIDKTTLQISYIKYFGKDGENYTIDILEFTPNIEMNDSMFVFNEKNHPDVEVIDLRE